MGRVRVRAGLAAIGVLGVAAWTVLPAMAAGAATASSGCKGDATSFDADGKQVDTVTAPGNGGTSGNPFEVDPEGKVKWNATADPAIPDDGTWTVETKSTPKLSFSGDGGLSDDSGTENLKDHLTLDVPLIGETRLASGTFYVKVVVEGGGASCTFAGYVKINGSPLGTPLFWGGVILGVGGLVLAFFATPTATATATAGAPAGAASETSAPPGDTPPADTPPADAPATDAPDNVPPTETT
jgi:hypothetical protein